MKIGITGSQGFISKHIIDLLKNKNGISFSFFDLPKNNLLKPDEKLKKFVRNKDVIIHTAAINRGLDIEIIAGSIVASYNLISFIKKPTKLIFLSSTQAETETLYGQSKKLTEIMLKNFSNYYKIPVSIFRLTNVFGEGCRPFYNSAVATFCYQIANNKKISLYSHSKNKEINLIYVKDVAKIIVKEIFVKHKKPFYFKKVSSKNQIKIEELAKLIKIFKNLKDSKKIKNKFEKDLYNTYFSYL
ncbi:NAD-dependent epimerase/dehydratase family protein [Candidatus Wolfebacteria bacterium]|nr:NAD-dependent epimerase/dehydratase family protein [Candidatus Wolfebacteria bacterium]